MSKTLVPGLDHLGPLGTHSHQHLTRRSFLRVTGATFVSAAAGASLLPSPAVANGSGIPGQLASFSPILFDIFGLEIPFHLPVEVDPFDSAMSTVADCTTITDFKGWVGLIETDGVSDPGAASDGISRRWASDVRFMKGWFKDRSGYHQYGTFGFF